jgi:tetratricopeptide (TPR) repeat protein
MLGASAYFAFKIYEHIGTLQDPPKTPSNENTPQEPKTADTFSPFSAEELVQKADEAFEEKDFVKALALLNEADAKEPNNEEILFKLGYILQQSGNDEGAIKQYKRALELNKENEFVHNSMASIYRKNREFTSAKIHLKASLDIDPHNPITYYNYGNLLVDIESFEEASEMYERAIELNPEFAEAKEELEKLKDLLE